MPVDPKEAPPGCVAVASDRGGCRQCVFYIDDRCASDFFCSELSRADESEVHFIKAPSSKFKRGDRVRKVKGSDWQGLVCGEYSTALTPEGYNVESEFHPGSVQLYPASALELVTEDMP